LFIIALFVLLRGFVTSDLNSNSFLILFGVVAFGFVLNGIYAVMLWSNWFPGWMAGVAAFFDVVLTIALLGLSLDYAPYLLPIMVFPVIMAGVRWDIEVGLLVAFLMVLGYGLTLVPIIRAGDTIEQAVLTQALINIGVVALVLFTAGALPGVFIRQRVELAKQDNEVEMEQLRLANERGKLVSKMALTMSSMLHYKKVLRTMIDLAFSAMVEAGIEDETTVGMVLLFEGQGVDGSNQLAVVAGHNLSRRDEGRRLSGEEGFIGRTIHTAEVKVTHKAQRDKILTSFSSTPGVRSAICAPLRAGFTTYGVVLFCTTEPNFYNEDHAALLTTFCSQAIIPLQNAQLFEDLQLEQERILEKEAEARRKLARDLHDGPTQSVAAIAMRLNFIKMVLEKKDVDKAYDEVIKVEEIAQKTTHEIRTMLFAMRPVILETQGLLPALDQYVERLRANESFQVTLNNRGYDNQLSSDAEGVVFAIIEEAIGNAKKHAQATKIAINLFAQRGNLYVEIKDNGVGFDVNATKSTYDQRTSLGLINMDERAQAVGGKCSLESVPGKGTAVRVQVPFETAKRAIS